MTRKYENVKGEGEVDDFDLMKLWEAGPDVAAEIAAK